MKLALFGRPCALVGMVHALPLPGSPGWGGSMRAVIEAARRDADALAEGGCDAIIVENMHDLPYLRGQVLPETVAAMTRVTAEVVEHGLPVGVQVLAGANRQALGVAVAAGAEFIRVEAYAYGHVADEGWLEATAGELARARAVLDAGVAFWADVRKKHAAHAVTGDLTVSDLAQGHAFAGADVLIATGSTTGRPTSRADVMEMASAGLPVAVGSGVTPDDAGPLSEVAAALIVGSWLKEGGDWRQPVQVKRVRAIKACLG